MKQTIFIIAFFLFSLAVDAQNLIEICQNKTTHLIAEEKITYLQVGDPDKLIAEVVPEQPNMVRVKAVDDFEGESSLTIVSANRSYSLFVKYSDTNKISYKLEDFHGDKAGDLKIGPVPEYLLKELCSQILRDCAQKTIQTKSKKDGIIFRLRNLYLKQDLLFFELEITNTTNIVLDMEAIHWWIDDRKQVKATNVQEYQVEELYRHFKWERIPAKTTLREVVVLPKFIVPNKRILKIELLEKALGNTGRKLTLEVKNKAILKANSF
jgi:conjugative transposon TraN protein